MSDIINVQLSICGTFCNNNLIDNLNNAKLNTVIGKLNRWKVLDPLSEDFNLKPLLNRLNNYELNELIQLEQEIRGYGKIQATEGSILGDWQYAINIRSGLFPHYYSNGSNKCELSELNNMLTNILQNIENPFDDLGLDIEQITISIICNENNIIKIFEYLKNEWDIEYDKLKSTYILEKLYESYPTYIIINSQTDYNITNSLTLYNNWQVFKSTGLIKNIGDKLIEDCHSITDSINKFELKEITSTTLNQITNYKKELWILEEKFSEFVDLIDTLEAFREYHLNKFINCLKNHICTYNNCLIIEKFWDQYMNELIVLKRIEKRADKFIRDTKNHLLTIDTIYQSIYNTNLQEFLRKLQIVGISIAVISAFFGLGAFITSIISIVGGSS